VSACAATELHFLRLFLLLLSLVNITHLPTQTGFPLVEAVVSRSTSARLAAFDWPTLLFFSSASRRWVGAAVSPVWHVPSQILHGVKLDPPIFSQNQKYPLSSPLQPRLRLRLKHIYKPPPDTSEDGGGKRDVGVGGSPARGPRIRVSDEEKVGDHRPELLAGLGGRQHGTLQLHLPAAPRNIHRGRGRHRHGGILSPMPGKKRGVC